METEIASLRMETVQAITSMGDVQASHIAIYLTILFAYILVAYVAGANLTRFQLALTTFIFIAASIRQVASIALLAAGAINLQRELSLMNAGTKAELLQITPDDIPGLFSIWWPIGIWSTGAVAALLFMWSIRHPKTERPL